MITKYTHDSLVWIDLECPTKEEVKELMEKYDITPAIADDLLTPTPRQRITRQGKHLYAVLHFPAFRQTHSKNQGHVQEIDFILGKDVIITTHYDTVDAIHVFGKEAETQNILNKTVGSFFQRLIKNLYAGVIHEMAFIENWSLDVEKKIFEGKEREMVFELSKISKNLIHLKQAVLPHREILEELEEMDTNISNSHFSREDYEEILTDYRRVESMIKNMSESISELRETNDSMLSSKQNEVMKMLTIIAFLTLPASLIASIFNMNVNLPIAGKPYDFVLIITVMIVVSCVLFLYFKKKKWL